MRILFCSLFLLGTFSVNAEHRVFQLKITNTKTKKSRTILSTLDPQQYIGYHYLGAYETITILDHWMCWERRKRFSKLCTRPTAEKGKKSLEPKTGSLRAPAAETVESP